MPLLRDIADVDVEAQRPFCALGADQLQKRKRDGNDEGCTQITRAIKKRRSKASKADVLEDENLDTELGINNALGKLDSRLLADYVAQRTKRFAPDLSMLEMEDQYLPERAIIDSSDWEKPRILGNLPEYLEWCGRKSGSFKSMSTASKKPGSPHTLVITGAGLRAADATRVLRTFQTKEATIAKLFAKHIKLKDAIDYVKKTRMGIGVGTPARLIDLMNAGALSSEKLERVVVDCSHIDQKKRGILDMKETQQPLITFLNMKALKSRYGSGKDRIELLFY